MKKALLFSAFLFFAGYLTVSAQSERKDIDLKSKPVAIPAGTNPKIKVGKPTTDDVTKESRPKPGGYGTGTCRVELSNYTSYCIDVYIDGYWEGSLGAYDDAYITTGSGYTTIYGISCGGSVEWDYTGANCYGSYSFGFY